MLALLDQPRYQRDAIADHLCRIIDSNPALDQQIRSTPSLLLKPNFVIPAADASNTHPAVYMAVATTLLKRYPGIRIGIGESPAIGSCKGGLRAHGVLEECLDLGIEPVEFKRSNQYQSDTTTPGYPSLSKAAELDHWAGVINLPKIKTHQQFRFTAACKNLYGCVVGKRKFVRHNQCRNDPVRFARMIIANTRAVDCLLHIGDAIDVMHVRGPRGGQALRLGKLIIADNPFQHDWLACKMIGLDPHSTPLFKALDEKSIAAIEQHVTTAIAAFENFAVARQFVHAPATPISFSPWHIARSLIRRARYSISSAGA